MHAMPSPPYTSTMSDVWLGCPPPQKNKHARTRNPRHAQPTVALPKGHSAPAGLTGDAGPLNVVQDRCLQALHAQRCRVVVGQRRGRAMARQVERHHVVCARQVGCLQERAGPVRPRRQPSQRMVMVYLLCVHGLVLGPFGKRHHAAEGQPCCRGSQSLSHSVAPAARPLMVGGASQQANVCDTCVVASARTHQGQEGAAVEAVGVQHQEQRLAATPQVVAAHLQPCPPGRRGRRCQPRRTLPLGPHLGSAGSEPQVRLRQAAGWYLTAAAGAANRRPPSGGVSRVLLH